MGAAFARPAGPRLTKGVFYDEQGRAQRSVYDDLREGFHPTRPLSARVPLADAPHPGFDGYYEDDLVMSFVPNRPCAAEHVLVVPKDLRLRSVYSLGPEHAPLLRHLEAVGREQLRKRVARADSPARGAARFEFSYHVPPFNSVDHLHLHAFALPFSSLARRIKYLPGTPWCAANGYVLALLGARGRSATGGW